MGDADLTLRASACPGILTGYTGAVIGETQGLGFLDAVYCDDVGMLWFPDEPERHQCFTGGDDAFTLLDLSRPEVADHVARWVAARVGLECGATAPGWRRFPPDAETPDDRLWLLTVGGRGASFSATWTPCRVPALAALDPADDTRTPSGARRVDLLALRLVAEHVGQGVADAR